MSQPYLDSLFRPKSIAFIGASQDPGRIGTVDTQNLLHGGFDGPITPITRRFESVGGVLAYLNVASLPRAPELAIIGTPPEPVPWLVDELVKKGARAAIVLRAGMSGVRDERGRSAVDAFSHFIALVECADVGFAEVIGYLSLEPFTKAILLYMKTLLHPRRFMSAARAAARSKPVRVIKAARAAETACAGAAQASPVVESDAVFDAAFRRAGMLRVLDSEELFAAVETLARSHPLRHDDLTLMANGDGIATMARNALIQGGGNLSHLFDDTLDKLDSVLPVGWSHGNPVNIRGDAAAERYSDTMRILLAAKEVDTLLVLHAPTAVASSVEAAEAVAKVASQTGSNILTCWIGEEAVTPARNVFSKAGIPTCDSPSLAVRAFLHRVDYCRNQELLIQPPSIGALGAHTIHGCNPECRREHVG